LRLLQEDGNSKTNVEEKEYTKLQDVTFYHVIPISKISEDDKSLFIYNLCKC